MAPNECLALNVAPRLQKRFSSEVKAFGKGERGKFVVLTVHENRSVVVTHGDHLGNIATEAREIAKALDIPVLCCFPKIVASHNPGISVVGDWDATTIVLTHDGDVYAHRGRTVDDILNG